MQEVFCTVKDWFNWRRLWSKEGTVEAEHQELTKRLGWECTDVLYSFLGLYTIGLLAFYPQEFRLSRGGFQVRFKDRDRARQSPYSFKFLYESYPQYPELNKEVKKFLMSYQRIGNVYPIWPGGNKDKGTSSVYDLPDFYFRKHPEWSRVLLDKYPEAHLESVIDLENTETIESFLEQIASPTGKERYKQFLEGVCSVIANREEAIFTYAGEHGFNV